MFVSTVGVAELQKQESAVKALCAAFDPESIPLSEVPAAYAAVAAMRKAIAGAETRLARRVDESKVWQRSGAADAAEYLARAGGTSIGAARDTLSTSRRLASCPVVDEAVAAGSLSAPQAAVIADAAVADPAATGELLAAAETLSLAELRDECGRTKAAAIDVAENERRIHARRSLREYVDAEGAWHLHAAGTIAAGARIRAVLEPLTERRFTRARRAGRREPRQAYAFDALIDLAGHGGDSKRTPSLRHLGLIRIDHEALRRGAVAGDEVCEIAGLGAVSVPAALELLPESTLKLVITRGADVVNVTHLGRGLNTAQQVAQLWQQPGCTTAGLPPPRAPRERPPHPLRRLSHHHPRQQRPPLPPLPRPQDLRRLGPHHRHRPKTPRRPRRPPPPHQRQRTPRRAGGLALARAAQPGRAEAADELAGVHRQGAEGDGALPVLGGDVVVVALEPAALEAEPLGERVELLEVGVADEVGPAPPSPRPHRLVHEDRHAS